MEPLEAWCALDDRVAAWSPGEPDALSTAAALLEELAAAVPLRQSAPPRVEALRSLVSRYLTGGAARPRVVGPGTENHPLLALLATQPGCVWPWLAPEDRVRELYEAPHDEALRIGARWASLAASVAPAALLRGDDSALKWLALVIHLRQRPHWTPAAVAIARLCTEPLAGSPWARVWEDACAALHAKRNPAAATAAATPGMELPSRRHLQTIATVAAVLSGGRFGGRDGATWCAALDKDNLDSVSAAAGALALAGTPAASAAAASVLARNVARHRATLGYQVWDAARELLLPPHADHLAPDDAAGLWRLLLDGPAPDGEPPALHVRVGEAFDAGVTLLWLRRHGLGALEGRLREGRLASVPGVAAALDVTPGEWAAMTRAALARLAPEELRATPSSAHGEAFAAAFHLLRAPFAADLDWRSVAGARIALGGPGGEADADARSSSIDTSPGKVGQVGWIDVSVLAVGHDALFKFLVHTRELDATTTVEGRDANGATVARRVQRTRGISRLVAARWKRSDAGWGALPDVTQTVGAHIVRRCVVAGCDDASMDAVATLVLAILSADAPAWDMRNVRADARAQDLWAYVEEWLPRTAGWDRLRAAIAPVRDMERARGLGDPAAEAEAFDAIVGAGSTPAAFPTLAPVGDGIRACLAQARVAAAAAPRVADGVWSTGGQPEAGPRQVRAWWQTSVVPLARRLQDSATQIARALHEAEDPENRARVKAITELASEEVPDVVAPVLPDPLAARWRAGLTALRELAQPQPWHVESAVDEVIAACSAWLQSAATNEDRREHLLEQLREAMVAGDEAYVEGVLAREDQVRIVDRSMLRGVGTFFLKRIRFDAAAQARRHAEVPSALSYFWPLILGVIGAPLSAIQTNYIWEPVLDSIEVAGERWKYIAVVLLMLSVCCHALAMDAHRRLPELRWRDVLKRVRWPIAGLFVANYSVNGFVFLVAGRLVDVPAHGCADELLAQNPFTTILLWGSLSMYLGLFLGLIAQGQRIDSDADG